MRGFDRALRLLIGMSIALAGCFGAYQIKPDEPQGTSGLTPNVEDKDAGLVAVAPGFELKTYRVIAVNQFPVTDAAIKDDDDRRLASRWRSSCSPSWCAGSARAASSSA